MPHRLAALFFMLLVFAPQAFAASPYFTLSTYKTFAPGEKPSIHLYTRNVPELEFRIYHVNDPEKFVAGLSEMHSFGDPALSHFGGPEHIDEKTWLERFHDWKHDLLYTIKCFFRRQLSSETRDAIKVKQSGLVQRSRIVGVAQFAQIPLLNDKQLVARWHQQVPPAYVSDNQILPIDPLPAGMYLMEATDGHLKAYTLLMISQTALVTRTVSGQMFAFVVDRKSGVPVAGAKVVLALGSQPPNRVTTHEDGVAAFNAPPSATAKSSDHSTESSDSKLWVMARTGDDVALVAPWYSVFTQEQEDRYASYVYTDRPVYRPGHTVHFKVLLRERSGDSLVLPKFTEVHVTIADGESKTLFDKQLSVSPMGSVSDDLPLPAAASLSNYSINVTAPGSDTSIGYGDFIVEDYRKPEYQVHVTAARQRVMQGESDQVTIDSRYFFGEPVANAKVKYRVYESTHYWWGGDDDSSAGGENPDGSQSGNEQEDTGYMGDQNSEQTGRLDANGKLTVSIPTAFNEDKHFDKDYVVEAGVTDEAGREITGRYRILATYGSFRLQVEPLSYSVQQGQNSSFQITAVDYDGKPVQTPVHLHLYHRAYAVGSWPRTYADTPAGDADATTGADGTAVVQIPVNVSGSLNALATATTPEKRIVQDVGWLWVSGNKQDTFSDDTQQVRIVADKKSYAPGDTAHLTLITQVDGFQALITASGYSVEFRKVLGSTGRNLSFDLPITTDSQPNLTVDVVFLKDEKVYQGQRSIAVPPAQQQLQIGITPTAESFQPGQAASYDVTTRDFKGAPVVADLSFGVVDEAIYSLYPDSSGNIVKALYPERSLYADIENSLTYYFTGEAGLRSPMLALRHSRYRPQLAQVKPGNDVVQPRIRKNFPDTAFWQPDIHTDAQGHARVTLNFPDSLTTWRATVRAITADSKAGSSVNRVLVRKNIIVRMGQPRFLRKGDLITVPVIVHNYLPETKQIQLSLDATGVDIVGGAPQQVTVAPGGEASILYRLKASTTGTAKLTAKAMSTQESDAMEVSLPVHPSGVAETLAASGILPGSTDNTTTVVFPTGTDPAAHSLQIQVSPSIAGSLFSALDYLTSFPYGCTEQTMSSFLPNIIVTQAMQQLQLPSKIDQAQLNAKIDAGLTRLQDYHHDDGGWGWWKEDQSQVFMTAYVVSGLAQAQKAGIKLGPLAGYDGIDKGIDFLRKTLAEHPHMLPELRAYVVYALAESDTQKFDSAKLESMLHDQLNTLYSRRSDLGAQALAYTGLAMLDARDPHAGEIAKLLESKAKVEGDLANWPASRNNLLDIDYDGSAESTAFVVKFLSHADPNSPLLPKAAQWLVANRSEGYWWSSTQQTAFVLYGLTDYLSVSHELNADTDVEVFLNGSSAAKRHFSRDDTVQGAALALQLDASQLQPQQNTVRIVTHGSGRAYWSTQAGYFSTAKSSYQQGSLSLNIARDYYVLIPSKDNDGHIVYDPQPLRGPVSQGDVLAVHIGITGSLQKYLLIEDPIPAGVEFIQQTDGYNIVHRPSGWDWWYTRQEFHDDHAAIFSSFFEGRHDSFYLLKVVNPGSFVISPARVAPMYQPGVQATTDELHLDVKEVVK